MNKNALVKSMLFKALLPFCCLRSLAACSDDGNKLIPDPGVDPDPDPIEREARDLFAASGLVATYADGQAMDFTGQRPLRGDKVVALFYFQAFGSHGYDKGENHNTVQIPKPTETRSPYDINEILKANPLDPEYGPEHASHHWGKPYFDYYVPNDRWVIRKHAQLLSDAGIDVIVFDVTNAFHYLTNAKTLCEEFMAVRQLGNSTPQVAFMINAAPENTLKTIYNDFYRQCPEFEELWFMWQDKPLVLAPKDGNYGTEIDFFTRRYSWFDTNGEWFDNGNDVWPWGDYYPQKASKEAISIMPATHATTGIGRSHNGHSQPENPSAESTARGTYFKLQMNEALKADPDVVFITGWNEWTAMRFIVPNGRTEIFLGKQIHGGDSYFVDLYNHEFSRDIEPLEGGFGDNYYYYMVDFIRQYKGIKPPSAVKEKHTVTVDGNMAEWEQVESRYYDDIGDITSRSHHGYGYRVGQLTDNTGRNDIVETRVATDGVNLYFYVETDSDMTPYTDPMWMRLFIDVKGSDGDRWEGFSHVVNNQVTDAGTTVLQKCKGGWNWEEETKVNYAVSGNKMEIAIPLASLGIGGNNFTVDFKWIDNAVSAGDIMECMKHGDSAPNARFRYRFIFEG